MASLRDVLNHIGKKAEIEREGTVLGQMLAIERGGAAFVEPKVEPRSGDILRFVETGRRFRVRAATPELVREKVDHYRVDLDPI